ncbi:MAG: prepilin peptidase, partial [Candidatus Paceibacterota bacterium]
IQLRKCRGCKNKISWQYPVVEILSAVIFVLVPVFLISFYRLEFVVINLNYLYLLSGFWVLIFLSWLVVTFIDLKHYIIPNKINLFIGFIGVLIVVSKIMMSDFILPFHNSFLRNYSILFSPFENIVLNHALGALVAGGFFLLIFVLSKGRGVGLGDVKLMFFSGIALGFPDVGLAMMITFLLGGIWGGFLLITNKKDMKDSVPFGPLLILGMVITFFFGFEVVSFYFSLFGI